MEDQKRYSPELRERAVRMVIEHGNEYPSQWSAIVSISSKVGCTAETLRRWVRLSEVEMGRRGGLNKEELEHENRELRRVNEILRKASVFFAQAELDRRRKWMVSFIDEHQQVYGVEPICRVLPIAPSTYYKRKACLADPAQLSKRFHRDAAFRQEVKRV